MSGSLVLLIGPMFSGKTTWLNAKLTMAVDVGYRVLRVSSLQDTRQDVNARDTMITTHHSSYNGLNSSIECQQVASLNDLIVDPYQLIGIDEAQFFSDLTPIVVHWVNQGKHVIVAGLSGDAFQRPFGRTLELIPLADEVHVFQALCQKCQRSEQSPWSITRAPFTRRIVPGEEQVLVGGRDCFVPVCRYHYDND